MLLRYHLARVLRLQSLRTMLSKERVILLQEGSGSLELHQHYTKSLHPQDEFGKLFFGDWDDDEWCVFDNYMIECLQLYLNEGSSRK